MKEVNITRTGIREIQEGKKKPFEDIGEEMTKKEEKLFIAWCWFILTLILVGGLILGMVVPA